MRRLLTLTLAVALLAGCSAGPKATNAPSGTNPAVTSDKQVELTVLTMPGFRREALDDAIDIYEEKHPNTKIRVRELNQQQLFSSAGGANAASIEGGDLAFLLDGVALNYQNAGQLRDLSSMRLPQLDSLAAPLFAELGISEGKRYGVPIAITPSMLSINPDSFAKAGVTVPNLDWTVQEFEQSLLALKAANATFNLSLNFALDPLMKAFGGQMYDGTQQAWTFDTPEAKQALALIGRLTQPGIVEYDTGGATRIMIGRGPGGPAVGFLPGGITVTGGLDLIPFPKGPKGRFNQVSSHQGVVLKDSANPEVAADFLREMITNPAIQQAMGKSGVRPVLNDSKALAAWQEAVGAKAAEAQELALEGGYVGGGTPRLNEVLGALEPFLKGKAGLDETVVSAMAKLK